MWFKNGAFSQTAMIIAHTWESSRLHTMLGLSSRGGRTFQGVLAIRRIFSLQNLNFQIALIILKLVCFGRKICIESIKIGFKAIHHLQSLENLRLLLPPLILRL